MNTLFRILICLTCVSTSALGKGKWAQNQKIDEEQTAEFLEKYPTVRSDKFVVKTVSLAKGGALELNLRIERPKDGRRCPVVFYVHGGAWVMGTKAVFCPQSFELAKHGIAGVRIEYRWKKHGGKFTNVITDILDAIDFIRQRKDEFNLDFTKVGLSGSSAGGHLSAIAAQLTPECICYDGYNGLYDAIQRDGSKFGGGSYTGKTDAEKKNASAIYIIKDNPPHTLLYHGTKDTSINYKQSQRFAQAIQDKGGQADVLIYEGVGHGFYKNEPYRSITTKALLDHTSFVFGMTKVKPNMQDYFIEAPVDSKKTGKKRKKKK